MDTKKMLFQQPPKVLIVFVADTAYNKSHGDEARNWAMHQLNGSIQI
jgi:hypothetical protein